VLCTLWSAVLIFRVVTRDPFSSQSYPFQDVFLGMKFYGRVAHITMAIQAIIYGALGIGILLHQRWGLILGLLYFAQVVIGHVRPPPEGAPGKSLAEGVAKVVCQVDGEPVGPAPCKPVELSGPRGRGTDQDKARGFPSGPGAFKQSSR
jgi:hypothetical protein